VRGVAERMMAAVMGKEPLPESLRDDLVTAMARRPALEHEPGLTG
jgi:hypothetical protein